MGPVLYSRSVFLPLHTYNVRVTGPNFFAFAHNGAKQTGSPALYSLLLLCGFITHCFEAAGIEGELLEVWEESQVFRKSISSDLHVS